MVQNSRLFSISALAVFSLFGMGTLSAQTNPPRRGPVIIQVVPGQMPTMTRLLFRPLNSSKVSTIALIS